jgi:hypothetical protein
VPAFGCLHSGGKLHAAASVSVAGEVPGSRRSPTTAHGRQREHEAGPASGLSMRGPGRRRSASWRGCELVVPATSGPWWSARNFPCWPALDDWFTATNLISALARPGHHLTVTTDRSLVVHPLRRSTCSASAWLRQRVPWVQQWRSGRCEVSHVAGDHGHVVDHRGGGDQGITI